MPPWGWWPLAIIGIVIFMRLLANQPPGVRFVRGFIVGVWWLFPATLWMWDLTPPGYIIQGLLFSVMYGVVAMLSPPGRGRWLSLPAGLVLVAFIRWNWPFGGVPLATIAMSQTESPLGQTARVFGSLLVVSLVGACAVAIIAAIDRSWKSAGGAAAFVVIALIVAAIAPSASAVDTVDIAIVQGGGPQNTLAINTSARDVFERHIAASELVEGPVDFVLWPENVVHSNGPIEESREYEEMVALAKRLDAPLIAGIVETYRADSDTAEGFFLNASIVITPEGETVSRYDKVRRVPFGEYVPFRSIIESVAPEFLPSRDAKAGDGPAFLDTDIGRLGISISWEIFHDDRGYDAAKHGGRLLLNPTNGSSYWLTIVQTQQIASSQLRAIETGRYVLQAAPTGFSAIIEPDGTVIDRSGVSEAKVIHGTVELREGLTLATRVGPWPMVIAALIAIAAANPPAIRRPKARDFEWPRRPSKLRDDR